MNSKFTSVFLIFIPFALSASENDKLDVVIYYETQCVDCINFFIRHLKPSMIDNGRLKHTNLKLIPLGKAHRIMDEMTGEVTIKCHHGKKECKLNALHACILDHYDIDEAFKTIACLMEDFDTVFEACADKFNVDVHEAKTCLESRSVSEILQSHFEATDAKDVYYLPSVEIEDIFCNDEDDDFIEDFDGMFCQIFVDKFNYTLPHCGPPL